MVTVAAHKNLKYFFNHILKDCWNLWLGGTDIFIMGFEMCVTIVKVIFLACSSCNLSYIPGVPKKYTDFVDPSDNNIAWINSN